MMPNIVPLKECPICGCKEIKTVKGVWVNFKGEMTDWFPAPARCSLGCGYGKFWLRRIKGKLVITNRNKIVEGDNE
jgi:hypothetical protein